MKQSRTSLLAAASVALFSSAGTASAQLTLVPNGDFETAAGANWVQDGGAGSTRTFETTGGNPDGYASMDAAGGWGVVFTSGGGSGDPVPLTTLSLNAGTSYDFNFDAISVNGANTAVKFEAYTGLTKIDDTGDIGVASIATWGNYTQNYSVPAAADGLKIVFVATGTGATGFDNVGVLGVPEPASLALLGLGGLAIAGRRRNR